MAAAVPTFESLDSALSVVDLLTSGAFIEVQHYPMRPNRDARGKQHGWLPENSTVTPFVKISMPSVGSLMGLNSHIVPKLQLKPNARDSSGATGLIIAVKKQLMDTVEIKTVSGTGKEADLAKTELMRLGQPPEAFTHVTDMKDFNEPSLFVIDQLLKAGVAINAEDDTGKTALDYARELAIAPVIKFLTDRGAKISEAPKLRAEITALEGKIDELLLHITMAQVPDTDTGKKIEKLQRALAPFYEPPAMPRPLKSDSTTLQKVRAELLRTRDKLQEQLDNTLLKPKLRLLKLGAMAAALLPETAFIAIMAEEAPPAKAETLASRPLEPAAKPPISTSSTSESAKPETPALRQPEPVVKPASTLLSTSTSAPSPATPASRSGGRRPQLGQPTEYGLADRWGGAPVHPNCNPVPPASRPLEPTAKPPISTSSTSESAKPETPASRQPESVVKPASTLLSTSTSAPSPATPASHRQANVTKVPFGSGKSIDYLAVTPTKQYVSSTSNASISLPLVVGLGSLSLLGVAFTWLYLKPATAPQVATTLRSLIASGTESVKALLPQNTK